MLHRPIFFGCALLTGTTAVTAKAAEPIWAISPCLPAHRQGPCPIEPPPIGKSTSAQLGILPLTFWEDNSKPYRFATDIGPNCRIGAHGKGGRIRYKF